MNIALRYDTAVEPAALVQAFVEYPPEGFNAALLPTGVPVFAAEFDLTTTLDEDLRQRLMRLPGYARWRSWLRWRTSFSGCTSTEYLPLPQGGQAEATIDDILRWYGNRTRLLIIKDLALDSPLLRVRDNRHSAAFMEALRSRGFVLLEGMPLAWLPVDYRSVDEYLGRLSASRRKDIRRKLKSRDLLDIRCVQAGDDWFDDAAIDQCYALYLNVHAQSQVHFDLLSKSYLGALLRDPNSGGRMFLYHADGVLIGWNLCYVYEGKLVDKYVGFLYPQARQYNLYFVSWMYNLQYALDEGLSHYVAGWTDARIKRYLGATITPTWHAVWARNPLLRMVLRRCAHLFQGEADGGG